MNLVIKDLTILVQDISEYYNIKIMNSIHYWIQSSCLNKYYSIILFSLKWLFVATLLPWPLITDTDTRYENNIYFGLDIEIISFYFDSVYDGAPLLWDPLNEIIWDLSYAVLYVIQ